MSLDQEFVSKCEECSEIELYMLINATGGFIWKMSHDMADGRIPKEDHESIDKDLLIMQQKIEHAVSMTTRFGVESPQKEDGGATDEYWRWFRWWNGYVEGLPQDDWRRLEQATNNGEDLSEWKPEGDWRTKPVETAGLTVIGWVHEGSVHFHAVTVCPWFRLQGRTWWKPWHQSKRENLRFKPEEHVACKWCLRKYPDFRS